MRSLLFVPADAPKKLDKAIGGGADAIIIDLEDSIAPDRKDARRDRLRPNFCSVALARPARPRLLGAGQRSETGLTDADLDAVVPARPDAIMLPKAEGGASVIHADAKLTAREALHAARRTAPSKSCPSRPRLRQPSSWPAPIAGASARLIGLTWGAEDLSAESGAEANRDA